MASLANELQARLRRFAVRVLKFVRKLPRDPGADVVARQLARAGTGASSNYRAARRARSRAEFIAKLGVAVEEADEAEDWLGVARDSDIAFGAELNWLIGESADLRAILVASPRTARDNRDHSPDP
jgi:four helix bundle protein